MVTEQEKDLFRLIDRSVWLIVSNKSPYRSTIAQRERTAVLVHLIKTLAQADAETLASVQKWRFRLWTERPGGRR